MGLMIMEKLFAFLIVIGIVSATLAALIVIDISIPYKVLLVGFLFILYLMFKALSILEKLLVKILLFIRADFIANEMRRLDPENRTPAMEILASDVEGEKVNEEIERNLLGFFGVFTSTLAWIILAAGVTIGTAIFWQVLR